ncbi:kinase-like domain-containing protein, partial [Polychytrium aggregatum]|uniref:kinase-like domain-containing protein n=1 Tax=Polychytrium aggregatum TaxID=110093 RepID=UPI0022FF084E
MTSRATVRPAPERPSWFIPDDAVTDWSQEHVAVGGYGEVFTAFYYGSKVAVKRLHAHFDDDALTYFAREIGVWHRLSHPYILPLLGACDKDTRGKFIRPFMVSPFMPNGTLLKYVSDPNNPRSTEEKLRLLYQVAAGVAYLHGNSIIHADLKAANVLLDSSFNAVLTDFGLSRTKRTSESAARARTSAFEGGTQGYMAPEMLDGDEPAGNSKLTDVFAFAVTIYEVINNGKVWITKDNTPMQPFQIGFQICSGKRPKRFDGIPDDIWDLIERCWAQSPSDRPSFAEILVALQ